MSELPEFTEEQVLRYSRHIILPKIGAAGQRKLLDATQLLAKPLVYGSIYQFDGQASVFLPGPGTPCYRCLFPEPPPPGTVPSCAEGGVFGVLPGIVGSIQAVETIKLITGIGEPLVGRILLFDALAMEFTSVKLRWNPSCPVCGEHPTVT